MPQQAQATAAPTPPPAARNAESQPRIDTWEQVRRDLQAFNRWRFAREIELAAEAEQVGA